MLAFGQQYAAFPEGLKPYYSYILRVHGQGDAIWTNGIWKQEVDWFYTSDTD